MHLNMSTLSVYRVLPVLLEQSRRAMSHTAFALCHTIASHDYCKSPRDDLKYLGGAEDMTHQLERFAQNLHLISSTHMPAHNCLKTPVPEDPTHFSTLHRYLCGTHTYM